MKFGRVSKGRRLLNSLKIIFARRKGAKGRKILFSNLLFSEFRGFSAGK
jgi:hypothetical protein